MAVIHHPRDLGVVIRKERRSQGLRQEELALAAGTGRRFISEVERGKTTARFGDVLRVLDALGLVADVRKRERGDQSGDRGA